MLALPPVGRQRTLVQSPDGLCTGEDGGTKKCREKKSEVLIEGYTPNKLETFGGENKRNANYSNTSLEAYLT